MKTEALNYTLIASGLTAVIGLIASVRVDLDVGVLLAWSTAAVLLAMAPMTYRPARNSITGR